MGNGIVDSKQISALEFVVSQHGEKIKALERQTARHQELIDSLARDCSKILVTVSNNRDELMSAMTRMSNSMTSMSSKLHAMEERIEGLDGKVDSIIVSFSRHKSESFHTCADKHKNVDQRLVALEGRTEDTNKKLWDMSEDSKVHLIGSLQQQLEEYKEEKRRKDTIQINEMMGSKKFKRQLALYVVGGIMGSGAFIGFVQWFIASIVGK